MFKILQNINEGKYLLISYEKIFDYKILRKVMILENNLENLK